MMKKYLFSLAALLTSQYSIAQSGKPDVLAAGGGFTTGAGFTNSFSIGEMTMVNTFSSGNFILTQGFQQPSDLSTGIAPLNSTTGTSTYPNPSNGDVYLEYDLTSAAVVTIEVFDVTGKCVYRSSSNEATGHQKHKLDLSGASSGVYMIRNTIECSGNTTINTNRIILSE